MSFWIIAGLMTLAAAAIAVLPLLRPRSSAGDRRAENLEIYRRRLEALEREVADGILPPAEAENARAELEKRLLEDIGDDTETHAATAAITKRPAHKIVPWFVLLALPLGSVGLYGFLETSPEVPDRMNSGDGASVETALPELVANLARRLRENPEDGEGWALLGRSYLFLEQPDKAAQAFAKAHTLLGDDPDLLVEYANALAMQSGGDLRGAADALLRKALVRAPDNTRALWLAGLAATQRGEIDQARTHWKNLLQQLDSTGEEAAAVRERLAELGGEAGMNTDVPAPGITVEVTLAPEIAAQVNPRDPVFIFARAAGGPPMPLAAVRRQVADLPLTIRLDDEDAMMPERTLSSVDRVVVGARISLGGGPIPQSGDFQGLSDTLEVGETGNTTIVIDSIVP